MTTVITTHINADFDAAASCLAASKLYPGARIVFPGSQERGLREVLLKSGGCFPDTTALKDIDLNKIELLVVVDTRQRARIGVFSNLLDRSDVTIHTYDHHPHSRDDIAADKTYFKPVGANTTLMATLLRRHRIRITPCEATFLALGIYEDTGSFTFQSTTQDDLKAASWLLEMGADLNVVRETLAHKLTPEHIALMDELLTTAVNYTIAGIPITIAKATAPRYIEDLSVLAHELMDMKGLNVLFLMALMEDHALIVGRSRDPKVNVGEILKPLRGGGHPMAASASVKGATLTETEERLISEIYRQLGAEPLVRDIMSCPALSVTPETPIYDIHDTLTRYGISVVPVVQEDKVLGLISRRTVEKAIYHGLAAQPAKEYMTTDFETIGPNETLGRVKELIVEKRQRFLPVVQDKKITGVITRTDLLQILSGDPSRRPEPLIEERWQDRNVSSLLHGKCSKNILDILMAAGETAEREGFQVYVAGGFVRDLLLRLPNTDVDLVVEGNGIAFAKRLAERFSARVRAHEKFQTAVIIFPDGFKVDVATARWEYYEYPAALPTVELSSIKLDLYRRDFTINAMAIKLNPKEFGMLIDFFGGQRDLKEKTIRVLHSLSLVEDPTRVFRAIRFEQRYGFKIGRHTLKLIENAVRLNIFKELSGKRISNELKLILNEADPRPALQRAQEFGLLGVIHPGLRLTGPILGLLVRLYEVLAWYDLLFKPEKPRKWIVYMLSLCEGLKLEEVAQVADRLGLAGRERALLTNGFAAVRNAAWRLAEISEPRPSLIYSILKPLDLEHLIYMMARAKDDAIKEYISHFITSLMDKTPILKGDDLKAMGLVPGPAFKEILNRLLMARLDGKVETKEDEMEFVAKEFACPMGKTTKGEIDGYAP
ncbi:MAG: CBS domain-containing protein [Dissulfurimicrobium hydrothermale]|uniref:CBS domain-containing protein n=1 Tax=Dissulfurimicrobium hydrothermale TaxID=1750598 RepID=UPI003C772B21